MVGATLDDLLNHLFGGVNSFTAALDGNFAVCARRNILVDLNICGRTLLQIIDRHTLGTNDSSHELLFGIYEISENPRASGWSSAAAATTRKASRSTMETNSRPWWRSSVCRWPTIAATTSRCPTPAATGGSALIGHFRTHVGTLIGKIGVGRAGSPLTTSAQFIIDQQVDTLHGFHVGIGDEKQNHFLGLNDGLRGSCHNDTLLILRHSGSGRTVVKINFGM
mmetsp:Transcript_38770/g.80520  ORF Transcript_38770/g.80520 Transcript_38770/m.80520 type:complete len:223 (+) Transcript_38770:2959-3627(+)